MAAPDMRKPASNLPKLPAGLPLDTSSLGLAECFHKGNYFLAQKARQVNQMTVVAIF